MKSSFRQRYISSCVIQCKSCSTEGLVCSQTPQGTPGFTGYEHTGACPLKFMWYEFCSTVIMGHILCIANLKGGVGKTTTAINLSAALAVAGKKILLVDCDPQGHATSGMGIKKERLSYSLYHAMMRMEVIEEIITGTWFNSLEVLPSRIELYRIETELLSVPDKEKVLKSLISDLRGTYDYIIVDTPPSPSLLTVNALTASDSLLIPCPCDIFALESLESLLRFFKIIRQRLNPHMGISGLLLTMYEDGVDISRRIAAEARSRFKDMVFQTLIPRSVHLIECATYGKPLLLINILSPGARSYFKLAKEWMGKETYMERCGNHEINKL